MRRIIAIAGLAQSGKSTIASYLKAQGFTEDSFAAPIRSCMANILGISLSQLEVCKDQDMPPFEYTPRRMMQTLGTEWGREMIQNDLWIVSLRERIKRELTLTSFVISDLRFENEAVALRDMGAEIWHIERPGLSNTTGHKSENGIMRQLHDYVILNDGTVDELYDQVDELTGARG